MTAKTRHDTSFSFSRRYFNWKRQFVEHLEDNTDHEEILATHHSSSRHYSSDDDLHSSIQDPQQLPQLPKKKHNLSSKLRSALTVFSRGGGSKNCDRSSRLGTKVVGTLFGYRRGHVHFAFQEDPKQRPAFLIEMATPTSVLVREMASGLVRIALECEKKKKQGVKLLEEGVWRSYCNGKKCGYALRRECGEAEWKVLQAVAPITMGAGVLPAATTAGEVEKEEGGGEGELMYMRARFERVVGSKDSEAFYMMNPEDGSGGPELSLYLLRA
ncbi:unnamed protein product [Linum tenue]|uniref:Protein MIZU-KUSSEI 1-like n=1 Tax=Linum tenue TaxID=586396 RepID=A0AAV0NKR0_9ROSI|nr:unnamed protein product [Linum tenue]